MSTTRWDGAVVPQAGDALLGAWPAFSDSVGTFIRVASEEEARARLAQAPAGVVSAGRPAVLLIGGVLYTADGTKSGAKFNLRPTTGYSGLLVDHWDKTDGRGRPTSDTSAHVWGKNSFTLYGRCLVSFTLDVCVSIVHSDFVSEAAKDAAVGSYFFGFLLDDAVIWKSEVQYNRTFMTHHLEWRQEVGAGSHTAAFMTAGGYGKDPYWHYAGQAFPGTRFRVYSLGATD